MAGVEGGPQGGAAVTLHVYDLSGGLAAALGPALLGKAVGGVWHTGVVVFGEEYFFGDGICSAAAGRTHFGRPSEVLQMGETFVPRDVLQEWVEASRAEFSRESYSLLKNNCNNFSDAMLQFLVGGGVPAHIKELPQEVLSTPLGAILGPALEGLERGLRAGGSSPLAPQDQATPAAPVANLAARAVPAPGARTVPAKTAAGAEAPDPKAEMERLVREEFDRIMSQGGIRPNEAAQLALRAATQRALGTARPP